MGIRMMMFFMLSGAFRAAGGAGRRCASTSA